MSHVTNCGETAKDKCDLFCIFPIDLKSPGLSGLALKSERPGLKPKLWQDPKLCEP